MPRLSVLTLVAAISLAPGCDFINQFLGPADGPDATAEADALLKSGDLPGAAGKYDELADKLPNSPYVATGRAYMKLLAGDYDGADKLLAAVDNDTLAEDLKPLVKARRALIAFRKGDLDGAKAFGEASEHPAGLTLAAEVYMADAEFDSALPLLEKASSGGGSVGSTAKKYLDYLQSDDPLKEQLVEATALWVTGQRDVACETAEDLARNAGEDFPNRNEVLLVWAGRAASEKMPDIAYNIVEAVEVTPETLWRIQSTKAMISAANGDTDEAKALFAALDMAAADDPNIPGDGLADAKATAAVIAGDSAFAEEILAGLEGAAVAKGLKAVGADGAAKSAAGSGPYADFLGN